jgi:hypothetical protein
MTRLPTYRYSNEGNPQDFILSFHPLSCKKGAALEQYVQLTPLILKSLNLKQLLHIVAIRGTVCNNIVPKRTANGDTM